MRSISAVFERNTAPPIDDMDVGDSEDLSMGLSTDGTDAALADLLREESTTLK